MFAGLGGRARALGTERDRAVGSGVAHRPDRHAGDGCAGRPLRRRLDGDQPGRSAKWSSELRRASVRRVQGDLTMRRSLNTARLPSPRSPWAGPWMPAPESGQAPPPATPPEITIGSTPVGPVFADAEGYTLYVTRRDEDPDVSTCLRGVRVGMAVRCGRPRARKPFGEWSLVPRRRRRTAVGLPGTAAVPLPLGRGNRLGDRAGRPVAVRHCRSISGSKPPPPELIPADCRAGRRASRSRPRPRG